MAVKIRREQLKQQYEDARFSFVMADVQKLEEEAVLKEVERLASDPAAAIPEDVDKRCLETIHRYYRKEKTRKAARKAVKVLGSAACITALLLTVALAASETVRTKVWNVFVHTFPDHASFSFAPAKEPQTDVVYYDRPAMLLYPTWVPEGYSLRSRGLSGNGFSYLYQDPKGGTLDLHTVYSYQLDELYPQDSQMEEMEIGGYRSVLIQNGDRLILAVELGGTGTAAWIEGTGIDRADIIRMAESIDQELYGYQVLGSPLRVGWVPEGFALKDQGPSMFAAYYRYESEGHGLAAITIEYDVVNDGTRIGIDTEDATVEEIQLNGAKATLLSYDPEHFRGFQLIKMTEDGSALITIVGENVGREELLRVAENLGPAVDGPGTGPRLYPGWLPKGVRLESFGKDGAADWCEYSGRDGGRLRIRRGAALDGILDGGAVTMDQAPLRDRSAATLVTAGESVQIYWTPADGQGCLSITATGIPADQVLRVADLLQYADGAGAL